MILWCEKKTARDRVTLSWRTTSGERDQQHLCLSSIHLLAQTDLGFNSIPPTNKYGRKNIGNQQKLHMLLVTLFWSDLSCHSCKLLLTDVIGMAQIEPNSKEAASTFFNYLMNLALIPCPTSGRVALLSITKKVEIHHPQRGTILKKIWICI